MNKNPFEILSRAIDYVLGIAIFIIMILFGVHLVLTMFHYWFG